VSASTPSEIWKMGRGPTFHSRHFPRHRQTQMHQIIVKGGRMHGPTSWKCRFGGVFSMALFMVDTDGVGGSRPHFPLFGYLRAMVRST